LTSTTGSDWCWLQLPPGAVPIFAGGGDDQLRAALTRSQKPAAAAAMDDINSCTSQVELFDSVRCQLCSCAWQNYIQYNSSDECCMLIYTV